MGGVMMTSKAEAKLADGYNTSEDLSEFDQHNAVPTKVKRAVTISVRFSDEEMAELRACAERANMKVTAFIRVAALEATNPVDRVALGELARDLEQRAHQVVECVARGA